MSGESTAILGRAVRLNEWLRFRESIDRRVQALEEGLADEQARAEKDFVQLIGIVENHARLITELGELCVKSLDGNTKVLGEIKRTVADTLEEPESDWEDALNLLGCALRFLDPKMVFVSQIEDLLTRHGRTEFIPPTPEPRGIPDDCTCIYHTRFGQFPNARIGPVFDGGSWREAAPDCPIHPSPFGLDDKVYSQRDADRWDAEWREDRDQYRERHRAEIKLLEEANDRLREKVEGCDLGWAADANRLLKAEALLRRALRNRTERTEGRLQTEFVELIAADVREFLTPKERERERE